MLGLPEGVTPEELAAARAALEGEIPAASTTTPAMDGTAAVGVGATWARADHVHPSDTSKADVGDIPDALSDLTNDAGFITSADVPTALSDLTNDIGAMRYLGANVITNSANDTAVNWIGFGTGYSMFSTTGALMDKPANYGMVLSWVNANNVTQLWVTVGGNNSVWKRSGDNANSNPGGWYGDGWKHLAEVNAVLPVQPTTDTIKLSGGVSPFGFGYATSTTNVRVFVPLPNNASGASVTYSGTITLASTSGTLQISAMSVYQIYRNGVWLTITTSGVTTATPVVLKGAASSSLIITWS